MKRIGVFSFRAMLCSILIICSFISCKKDETKTLRVSFSLGEDEWNLFRKKIIPDFEKKNNCTVETVQVDASDLPKLLEAGKKSGETTVDLFAQDNMQLAVLVRKGLVDEFSDIDVPDEVYPSMSKAGVFDGKRLFIPFRPNVQIFYYNKKKFDDNGLVPPKTWNELIEVAKIFKEREKTGRILIKGVGGAPTVTQMYEYIVSAGGDPMSFNDEGCIRTFNFFKELWKYASPDSRKAKWDTSNDYLARDSVYIMQNWPFGYNVIVEKYKKKDIAVYAGVRGPVREAHVIGGDFFGIPAGSKNRDLAVKFIEYMISKEVQSLCVKELSWPSIRDDAYGNGNESPVLIAVKDAIKNGVFRENVPYWSEFQKYFDEAFIGIVIKGGETESILNKYHEKMEQVKSKY